tara:strand:- start:247 stop:981 length:735 start_codon:yes stop_codon:yes gene_type:complete
MNWITFHHHVQKENINKKTLEIGDVIEEEEGVLLLEKVMNQRDLVERIENQNVMIKLNSREKKIGLREENSLAILIEAEESLRKIKEMANETNMEIRKNHILAIEALEEGVALVDKIDLEVVEVESMVTDPLEEEVEVVKEVEAEMILLETEAAEVETNMVTNLLVTEGVVEAEEVEVEVIMEIEVAEAETEMVETITEVETLGINRVQAKSSMAIKKDLAKNENPKIRVIEITNANLNNYSKV